MFIHVFPGKIHLHLWKLFLFGWIKSYTVFLNSSINCYADLTLVINPPIFMAWKCFPVKLVGSVTGHGFMVVFIMTGLDSRMMARESH